MEEIIKKLIKEFVNEYPKQHNIKTQWGEPIVKFSSAQDDLYLKLKEVVSPTHALPTDFLPEAKAVIAYFIPFDESIVKSNIHGKHSSKEWAIAYIETNKLISNLNIHINNQLEKLGFKSTIIPATHNFDEEVLISDWSHRHVAYISGLGKFGLNNMLITDKGCCGRIGSIITNLEIEPSKRGEGEHCLYKTKGICKVCVKSCVNSALKTNSFDRHKCYEMLLENDSIYSDLSLVDACGKCCVGLPCSTKNPLNN